MTNRRLRAAGAAIVAVLIGANAAEAACAKAGELAGLQARVLQTELMVAALSCGESSRYNQFVTRFRGELVSESKRMQDFFARVHGGRASRELNAFVTELANNSSQRSLTQSASFCPQAATVFDDVLKIDPRDLRGFAARQEFADAHGVDSCDGPREVRAPAAAPAAAPKLMTQVKLPAEKPVR